MSYFASCTQIVIPSHIHLSIFCIFAQVKVHVQSCIIVLCPACMQNTSNEAQNMPHSYQYNVQHKGSKNKGVFLFERKLWPTIKTGPTPVAQNQCCWHWRIGKIHTTLILGIHKLIGLVCCWGIYSSPLPCLYVYVGTELQCIDFRTSDIDIWTGFQAARYIDANLQQGHHYHQLILLSQGTSSISEPLGKWAVIQRQKLNVETQPSITQCTPMLNVATFL